MKQCSSSDLEGYLKKYGWSFKRGAKGVWFSGFSSESRSYPVRILLENNFLTLSVQPLVKIEVDLEAYPEAAAHILELNNQCYMVSLGVDEVGDITMSLNLLNGCFEFDEFATALGLIGYYSDILYSEIVVFFTGDVKDFQVL